MINIDDFIKVDKLKHAFYGTLAFLIFCLMATPLASFLIVLALTVLWEIWQRSTRDEPYTIGEHFWDIFFGNVLNLMIILIL